MTAPDFDTLTLCSNTFVTLEDAKNISSSLLNMEFFETAEDPQLRSALRAAHRKLVGMRFKTELFKKAHLNIDSLRNITSEEFEQLPEQFRNDVMLAQTIQANHLLSPTDSIEERRRKGIILETVNEVKVMFSNVTPVKYQLCERALNVLSQYLDRSIRIARA